MKKTKKRVKKVQKKVKRTRYGNVFLIIGLVFLVVGWAIYNGPGVWSLGFIFLLLGIILKLMKK